MPFYDYECTMCGKEFEVRKTVEEYEEQPDERCPECDSPCAQQGMPEAHVTASATFD